MCLTYIYAYVYRQSRWQRGLMRGSATARLLELRVRMPPGVCMSVVSVVCCQVGLCVGLVTRPKSLTA
jgi:predicted transporter